MSSHSSLQRTRAFWNQVWTILVEQAGALEGDRHRFVRSVVQDGLTEWRFCGNLGFGGKVWCRHDGTLYVSCYPENMTAEREQIIERTNAALVQI